MMKTFVLQRNAGIVVVNADNTEQAWELARKMEGEFPYLLHNTKPEDFVEALSLKTGVVGYFAT